MPNLAVLTEVVMQLVKRHEEGGLAKLALRLLVDSRTDSQTYFQSLQKFLTHSLDIVESDADEQTLALANLLTRFGLARQHQNKDTLHACLDSTWMSQELFEGAEALARKAKEADRQELIQRVREQREAS